MSDFLDLKKNATVIGRLALFALAIMFVTFVAYQFLGQAGKDNINNIGLGKAIIPWEDRADSMARKVIEKNKANIAGAIQSITHPTGKEPSMKSYATKKLNSRILVEFNIDWKGGFLGTEYNTVVSWEFSEEKHESAIVTFDSAATNISDVNADALNDYFRVKLYPVVIGGM